MTDLLAGSEVCVLSTVILCFTRRFLEGRGQFQATKANSAMGIRCGEECLIEVWLLDWLA